MTKPERRAAAKAAAAREAAAARRRKVLNAVLAGAAVVAVIVGAFFVFGRSDKPKSTAGSPASATPSTAANAAAFPPLPEGADPALKTKPTTSAGTGALTKLNVTVLIEGKGEAAKVGQTITVNYVGVSYKTGAEFDSSWSKSEAYPFPLGAGNVIKGWDQGLVGIKVGSRVQSDIPSDLAYGDNPSGGRPAGALRFIVDVLALR
jgi:peptidylprolyl isomerase